MLYQRHIYSAFSLLEVALVLAIISILTAIAAPRFGAAHSRYQVELAARRIAADLRQAQTLARNRSSTRFVAFDEDTDNYTIQNTESMDNRDNDYVVALGDRRYQTDLVTVSFLNTQGYESSTHVYFDMWGQPLAGDPVSGNPLAPLAEGVLKITSGTESRTISIAPITGEVIIP